MNSCMSEESLVALATGEGTAAERAHVRECPRCAARYGALDDDLRLLRQALLEEPLPAAARAPRVRWRMPVGVALAATALLALVWAAPWRSAPTALPAGAFQVSGLARDVSAALFAPSQAVTVQLSDSAYFEAAIDGGWPCGGLGLYGFDCQGADALALYEE